MDTGSVGAIPVPHLRKWRHWAGLSQEELATAARIKKLTVLEIEGGRIARFSTIAKLASALGVTRQQLLHSQPLLEEVGA